jgi:hypothetical protein
MRMFVLNPHSFAARHFYYRSLQAKSLSIRAQYFNSGTESRFMRASGAAVTPIPNIVIFAGLLIGLVFGAVGLLSGFCLTSGLRNWWTQGDGRLVRSPVRITASATA